MAARSRRWIEFPALSLRAAKRRGNPEWPRGGVNAWVASLRSQ